MHWKNWLPAMAAIGLCAGCGSGSNNSPIVKSGTTTTITASATKATTGGAISFSATGTHQAGSKNAAPTGTVTFLSGTLTVGTASLGSGGIATLAITALNSSQLS